MRSISLIRTFVLRSMTLLAVATGVLFPVTSAQAGAGDAPYLVSAASRKQHGAAGTFDLPLSLSLTNPSTEPRAGSAHVVVFTFDKAITNGSAAVTEGMALLGVPSFDGTRMLVPITSAMNQHYVSLAVTAVMASDGGTGGAAAVRIGFLLGDVNQSRSVDVSDINNVNLQLAQPVSAANYPLDVNASGTLSLTDKLITSLQNGKVLAAPSGLANQPPQVNAGAAQSVTLPGFADLYGSAMDDGLPSVPGVVTVQWSQFSGPGTVIFSRPDATVTQASFSASGTYVLRLAATDGALTNFSEVTVTATAGTGAIGNMHLTINGIGTTIDVLDFAVGANSVTSFGGGGGGGSINSNYLDMSFNAPESSASPLLLLWTSNASHRSTALLQISSPSSAALIADWTLADVAVTSVTFGSGSPDWTVSTADTFFPPTVRFTLSFAQITYRVYAANGTVAQRTCWNVPQNRSC